MDLLEKTLLLGLGAALLTKEKMEKTVSELVEKGKLTQDESGKLMNEMITRGREEREALKSMIQEEAFGKEFGASLKFHKLVFGC